MEAGPVSGWSAVDCRLSTNAARFPAEVRYLFFVGAAADPSNRGETMAPPNGLVSRFEIAASTFLDRKIIQETRFRRIIFSVG
jgi:hypothetical protein